MKVNQLLTYLRKNAVKIPTVMIIGFLILLLVGQTFAHKTMELSDNTTIDPEQDIDHNQEIKQIYYNKPTDMMVNVDISHTTNFFHIIRDYATISGILVLQLQSDPITISNGQVKDNENTRDEQIDKLRGKTLDIYSLLIEEARPFGIREVQRHFDYSSPNLATYHLEKLYQLDLVVKTNDNRYKINTETEPIGQYENKTNIAGIWLDNTIIQAIILFVLAIISTFFTILRVDPILWGSVFTTSLTLLGTYIAKN